MSPAVAICVFVVVLLVALRLFKSRGLGVAGVIFGGGRTARKHVIVDVLNMTHHLLRKDNKMSTEAIVNTIDRLTPILRPLYPGEIMFVVKDRESLTNDDNLRATLDATAKRNHVSVFVVEKNPLLVPRAVKSHASLGRDDFYMALLAHKWRAPVLSEDKFRDFAQMRESLEPFMVWRFSAGRTEKDYVTPKNNAYARIKRPRSFRLSDLGKIGGSLRDPPSVCF